MINCLLHLTIYETHLSITKICFRCISKSLSVWCLHILTCSAAKFHWTENIQVVVRQYGERLSDEQVNSMGWSTKLKYLKTNLVTLAKHIDHDFKQLWGSVILWNASYWSNFKF